MGTEALTQPPRFEHRWPVALAVLFLLLLTAVLPGRVRLLPMWVPYAVAVVILVPMLLVELPAARARFLRVERGTTVLLALSMLAVTLITLAYLIFQMVGRSAGVSGLQLLTSSVAAWATNVVGFALIYWEIDRGGPQGRETSPGKRPDWLFPQDTGSSDFVQPGWRPTFVDYLFLGYVTATAFSPTDALPMTSRAKMLMLTESTISLTTILLVAARAINILAS
jgi:hypothetical protein